MPLHNSFPGVMKFTIFVYPSLVIITVWSMPRIREESFLGNTSILHILPQNDLPWGCGVMKCSISYLLTLQMLYTKFGQNWPSSSQEEDFNGRRHLTPSHSNRSPKSLSYYQYVADHLPSTKPTVDCDYMTYHPLASSSRYWRKICKFVDYCKTSHSITLQRRFWLVDCQSNPFVEPSNKLHSWLIILR